VKRLGIDLGGSKLLACGLDDRDVVGLRIRRPTGRGFGPDAALVAITELAADACAALGGLDAIGIGFPGLVDHARGVARSSTMLDGWHDVELGRRIEASLGSPCVIDNDVNTAGLHEHARRGADLLYVAVGTGIGGALVLGGALWRGSGGFAGELGHVSIDRAGPACACGRRGCVHLYASGAAIEAAARGEQVDRTAPPFGGAAGRGHAPAVDATHPVVIEAAHALGIAIGSALNVLDVSLVVLGGGVAELGPAYIDAVAARARREFVRFHSLPSSATVRASPSGTKIGS
jgi:glucokinase